MESAKYAVVDIETTGNSFASGDRIIQIAIVIMQNWEITQTYSTFIHPGKSIPAFIEQLTNISDKDVEHAKPFEKHANYIYELLSDCVFVAHNADFDLPFLQMEFNRIGFTLSISKTMDTVELAKLLYPTAMSYKLSNLAQDLQIPLHSAHRADEDAKATALLLKKCYEKLLKLPLVTLEKMHKVSFRLRSDISHLIFECIKEKRKYVEDQSKWQFYHQLALLNQKSNVVNNNATTYPNTLEAKRSMFSGAMTNFEERPAQFEMMDIIFNTLQSNDEAVIEASTGIGKTIAYLLPAHYYCKANNKQIVISTYTQALMDQLLEEEVAKVEKIIGEKLSITSIKGMTNYIDVERFWQIVQTGAESYDEAFAMLQVLVWLTETTTGDLNELNLSGGGQLFIEKIRQTNYGKIVPSEVDFYQQALERVQKASLIVTNHANIILDGERTNPIFANVSGWIFDEAHQMIYAASSKNEMLFSFMKWKYLMGQIGLFEDEGSLISEVTNLAIRKQLLPVNIVCKLEKQLARFIQCFDEAMNIMTNHLNHRIKNSTSPLMKVTLFLDELNLPYEKFLFVSNVLDSWIQLAQEVANAFQRSIEKIDKKQESLINDWQFFVNEWKIKLAEWDSIFLLRKRNETIWIEVDKRSIPGSIQVLKKPLSAVQILKEIMEPKREDAIIWTSGTLTVPQNVRFVADQLSVPENVAIHQLYAPKNYYDQTRTFVVTDMPDIQQVPQLEYVQSVAYAIIKLAQTINGRIFVLFTSFEMLNQTAEKLSDSEQIDDYVLFAQGITSGSRMKLLKSFKKYSKSILLGTNSFWEGVDVPGDGLDAVIVVRLPFSAPDEPIFKAKSKELQSEGKNSFTELALPEAVLRLKQGFGRLVRGSNERGIFVVLDRRIEKKSYGEYFLNALPTKVIEKVALSDMVTQLEHWYNEER